MDLQTASERWDRRNESVGGYQNALSALGVELRGAEHVSEQRAMRLLLHLQGQPDPRKLEMVQIKDQRMLRLLSMLWLDGLGVGLERARPDGGNPELGLAQLADAARVVSSLADEGHDPMSIGAQFGIPGMPRVAELGMRRAMIYRKSAPASHTPGPQMSRMAVPAGASAWLEGVVVAHAAVARADAGQAPTGQPPGSELG